MAVREQVGTWAARPGYRVLLRQDGPLGRPLLWVPLVPGGPRVNEVSEQALTYSNLTVNTGIAGNGGGFYDFTYVGPSRDALLDAVSAVFAEADVPDESFLE